MMCSFSLFLIYKNKKKQFHQLSVVSSRWVTMALHIYLYICVCVYMISYSITAPSNIILQ